MVEIHGIKVLTAVQELVDPCHTSVLVVDMQNGVVMRDGMIDRDSMLGQSIPPIQKLLKAARAKGVMITYAEIIHTDARGTSLWDGPNLFCHRNKQRVNCIQEGSWEAQTIDELAPEPGDMVVLKNRASAFSYTFLDAYLKARNIKSLIVTGTSTRGCVLMTAVDAQMHGYYPVVLKDCVATGSQQAQELAIAWMESEMAVYSSHDVLSAWAVSDSRRGHFRD